MDDRESNKALIRRFVKAANGRDHASLDEIVSPTFRRHCPATPDVRVESREDFRAFLEADEAIFPDNRVVLDTLIAEGDDVAFWARYSGTQEGPMGPVPATGKSMECEFAGVFSIREGMIEALRVTWDNVGILAQLGHLPAIE
jgi:steroid delta-isomerase-like uncharacterized protein